MEDVELVIILERYKYRSISRSYPNWKGKTFTIPLLLFDQYLTARRKLQDLEDKIIEQATEQEAYTPKKDIQYLLRKLQEEEVHKFNDDGSVTIKKKK